MSHVIYISPPASGKSAALGVSARDERHGTVVGSCEREAAVYALAQLRSVGAERNAVVA